MNKLGRPARLYIVATMLAGAGLFVWHLPRLQPGSVWVLLAACALAAVTQVLKVEGSTNRSSYNIAWMVFGFTFLLLGAPATLFVILVAHLAEWIWHKYPWYIQLFNIASYALTLQAADLVFGALARAGLSPMQGGILGTVAAMATFTLVNHLLVGLVIWLARGESLAKSGVFGRLTLMIDFSLLCLGTAAALIWRLNPFAVIVTVVPLYLIYSTLRVPALERQTDIDPKTGLFNSTYFNRALEKELAHARRTGQPLTVAIGDLDLLRNINNTYGHLAGDTVLIGIAQLLQKSLRAYDVVARFGGEEFALLMPEVSPEQALSRLEMIRSAIEVAAFEVSTSVTPIHATMSFGVAAPEGPEQTAKEVLHNADVALYHSKLRGRNQISIYSNVGYQDMFAAAWSGTPAGPSASPASAAEAHRPAPPGSNVVAPPSKPAPIPARVPAVRAYPAWVVNAYIAALAAVALAGLGLELRWQPPLDTLAIVGLGFFAVLLILAEGLAIDIFAKEASVSTSVVPYVAAVLLFGPVAALSLSVLVAATALVMHRSPISRFVFNTGNHLLSGVLCAALVRLLGTTSAGLSWPAWFGLTTGAVMLAYVSSTSLIALAIHFDSGQPVWQVWSDRFRWLAPSYLVMGIVSFVLIFGYLHSGLAGAVAIILPLVILRFSQKQYIERTKTMVSQLRATNSALEKQTQEVSALNEELLMTLAHVTDLRDPYVSGHSEHVARYAVLVATELKLPPEQIELVRKAALLHDIGKLGIPETILFKPGPLTPGEYEAIKSHAVLGAEIVRGCHSLRQLVPIVRHHHERFDGRGYPDRLRGEEIPLEARIMSLADAIEAMASDRPYRRGAISEAILQELQANRGSQFDPQVVQAFSQVLRRYGESAIVNSAKTIKVRPPAVEEVAFGLSERLLSA
jgi:diguanylate cyclase (GGDEF)-like protein/putative nucleotidyltransferase with HDIG domain